MNPAWYPPISLTFEHYVRVWSDGGFSRYFFNTLVISIVDAIVMVIIASLAAYALVFMEFRGKLALQVLFLIGLMIPVTAIVLPLFQIVRSFGLLNTHLGVIFADLDDQWGLEAYWKVLFTPDLWITPGVQMIWDPSLNPNDDFVSIAQIKFRLFL